MSGGNSSHTSSDTLSDYWYIESKLKANVPFLKDFRSQNERALARGRMPLCIYVSGGISYVFLKYADFVRMVNACNPGEGKCTTDDLFFCSNWYIWTEYSKDMPYKSTFIDTQKKAAEEKKVPVLVVHEKGKKNDVCIMTLIDFISHLQPSVVFPKVGAEVADAA